jgi:hypothetical protein
VPCNDAKQATHCVYATATTQSRACRSLYPPEHTQLQATPPTPAQTPETISSSLATCMLLPQRGPGVVSPLPWPGPPEHTQPQIRHPFFPSHTRTPTSSLHKLLLIGSICLTAAEPLAHVKSHLYAAATTQSRACGSLVTLLNTSSFRSVLPLAALA